MSAAQRTSMLATSKEFDVAPVAHTVVARKATDFGDTVSKGLETHRAHLTLANTTNTLPFE